jgi:hypothetical protein
MHCAQASSPSALASWQPALAGPDLLTQYARGDAPGRTCTGGATAVARSMLRMLHRRAQRHDPRKLTA